MLYIILVIPIFLYHEYFESHLGENPTCYFLPIIQSSSRRKKFFNLTFELHHSTNEPQNFTNLTTKLRPVFL